MTPTARFLVGIDLGTTHAVVAYIDLHADQTELAPVVFEIEQLVAPGTLARKPLLPCLRYHAAEGELADHDTALPWNPLDLPGEMPRVVIGEWAGLLGARTSGRLVASAKSWLSHPHIDQDRACLPWGAAEEDAGLTKVTPTLASASYLFHIRQSWNHCFADAPLEAQQVVLTVPASFDEGARAQTLAAAHLAGLTVSWLLEEPQAVVYDWYARHRQLAVSLLESRKRLLVCDVGGGTTDFSLISVTHRPRETEPVHLRRIGVGDHLMLGGDNIDLALAHQVEKALEGPGGRLSSAALSQLLLQTRQAKEVLLGDAAPERVSVTLTGTGSRLIGGSRRTELRRETVLEVALDGFFPLTALDDLPQRRRSAVIEFGLPYAADPAITRHLAAFLTRHGGAQPEDLPDTLLLNGGAFKSPLLRQRLQAILEQWRGQPVLLLDNDRPHLAVACGAVVYGLARRGAFLRIGGGAARSYFLVIEAAPDAQLHNGLCLLPKGAEENQEYRLAGRRFALRVGQPVRFHLVSSSDDLQVAAGDLVDLQTLDVASLPPLIVALPDKGQSSTASVEVELLCSLTELGTLRLDCEAVGGTTRWNIEFQIRGTARTTASGTPESSPAPALDACREAIRAAFAKDARTSLPLVKSLRSVLERRLGKREEWDLPLSRTLLTELLPLAGRRRLSASHERIWLNTAGHLLRPGFGAPTDDWAIEQIWPLFAQGLQFPAEGQLWSEWWTFWRRVAGGLDANRQLLVYRAVEKFISPAALKSRKILAEPAMKSYEDMVRLAGSLERLPVAVRTSLASWLFERLRKPREPAASWWALGRLATRVPFHGSAETCIPRETVEPWLHAMLELDWRRQPEIAFAAVMMSRVGGDRDLDLDEALRKRIIAALKSAKAPENWMHMVAERHDLSEDESRRMFGETLPAGLALL